MLYYKHNNYVEGAGKMRMLLLKAIITVMVCILFSAAISCSKTPESKAPPGYFSHIDSVNGFSIDYPGGWIKPAPPPPFDRLVLLFFGPSQPCEGFNASFYVYTDRFQPSQTLEEYVENDIDIVKRSYREFSELVKEKTALSGLTAIKVECTYRVSDYTQVREMIVYTGHGSTVWKLDFIAASSCWNQYVATIDTIVDSFKISK